VKDDDVLVIPTFEEKNFLIDVLHEGNKTNEFILSNVSDLY